MNPKFEQYLLDVTKATACYEIEVIQSLWSGYGKISRIKLCDAPIETVVVKCISLNPISDHPRGWDSGFAHQRKINSYKIETHWYEKWSRRCTSNCRAPKFLGSFSVGQEQWIVLEDLDSNFPIRKNRLNLSEVYICLTWLAHFHATFLNQPPNGLWDIGTYWHLDTRPHEFELIEHKELKSKAHLIDSMLNQATFQTIVHGDAKLANFCFSTNGKHVAAVDFQYVGGGCGMKDVAYFIGSCLTGDECELYHDEILNKYFSELHKAINLSHLKMNFKALENEWRFLYTYACADFTRFLLGWMPTHRKINDYNLKMMQTVISDLA